MLGAVPAAAVLAACGPAAGTVPSGAASAAPVALRVTSWLVELRRVKDDHTARRMLVSWCYGGQDVTARLVATRRTRAEGDAFLGAHPARARRSPGAGTA